MHQKIEINSFLVTKLKDDCSFTKYDIEASIDEVENEEGYVRLKYKFVLLSNPTNVKISMDGFATIYGNAQEMSDRLGNDEKNIPRVVNTLYQEIFPFIYITSKTMQIPCPAYKLADIAKAGQRNLTSPLEKDEERHAETELLDDVKLIDDVSDTEKQTDREIESSQSLIQEQKIRTV
ncbi:MAG: hypothetical protein KGH88_01140 [Thaumarchaeota archaeon]|nr:hypothetical protein [Nitrososphaerota archaeon]